MKYAVDLKIELDLSDYSQIYVAFFKKIFLCYVQRLNFQKL